MNHHLMLRYAGTGGPLRVWVNGFLLLNVPGSENSGTRLEPYAIEGARNTVRVELANPAATKFVLQVASVPDDGSDGAAALLRMDYPHPSIPGAVAEAFFDLPPASLPAWTWVQLTPAPPAAEGSLHAFVAGLGSLLLQGPDDALLRQLAYKHAEIGAALGIGQAAMDAGLTQGLASRRATPGFRVDVAAPGDLVPAWSVDRRLVRPLRTDGRDAIQFGVGEDTMGFELVLGYYRDRWIVIR